MFRLVACALLLAAAQTADGRRLSTLSSEYSGSTDTPAGAQGVRRAPVIGCARAAAGLARGALDAHGPAAPCARTRQCAGCCARA